MKECLLASIAAIVGFTCQLYAAPAGDPLDYWHQLNPDADLYDLVDAHFQNGRWVAAINYPGAILNSSDGINWTRANFTAPSSYAIGSLQFGGSRWLVGAGDGSVATSVDGFEWTTLPDLRLYRINYGNGRWVAFANPSQTNPPQLYWSADGLVWKLATSTFDLVGLVFGGGQWLALGFSELMSSADGEHWVRRNLPAGMGDNSRSLAYGNGIWMILATPGCGAPGGCTNVLWKSLDGENWEQVTHDGGNIDWVNFVHQPNGGVWFGLGEGKICISTNLTEWTCAPADFGGGNIVWVGGRWVGSSTWGNYEVFVSTNGLDWRSATTAVPSRIISYGQGKWMGINNRNELLSSTNGRHWNIVKSFSDQEWPPEAPSPMPLGDLAFADGLWVLGGMSSNVFILVSNNGQAWNSATIDGRGPDSSWSSRLQKIRHTPEGWTALIHSYSPNGETYWALRSRDGRNWNWSQLGSDPGDLESEVIAPNLRARVVGPVMFSEGIWPSSIETSTDGESWTTRYVGPGLSDVALVNGHLVAISLYGSLLESDPILSLSQSAAGALSVRRAAGIPVVLESSADLSQWQTVTNFPFGEPIQNFIDPEARNSPARFYRARTP